MADVLATLDLARANGIRVSYSNGLATTTLPSGYLYNGTTGLTLDVVGLTRIAAWAEIAKDVQELVDNKSSWTKETESTLKIGDTYTTDGIEWKIMSIQNGMTFGMNVAGQVIHIKLDKNEVAN